MAKTHDDIRHATLVQQFEALHALSDGWYDGAGLAPDPKGLLAIETWLLRAYPSGVAIPALVPTPEGNVLLEWDAVGDPSVDIELKNLRAAYHAFLHDGTDLEREFDLNADDGRKLFIEFIGEQIGGAGA